MPVLFFVKSVDMHTAVSIPDPLDRLFLPVFLEWKSSGTYPALQLCAALAATYARWELTFLLCFCVLELSTAAQQVNSPSRKWACDCMPG
jgi:hypothetical protein